MKLNLATLAVVLCGAFATSVQAGSVFGAQIVRISSNIGNTSPTGFIIFFNGTESNIGCNASNLNAFAVDSTTAGGRAQIATALVAQASGQTITLIGAGNCNVTGNVETASIVSIP